MSDDSDRPQYPGVHIQVGPTNHIGPIEPDSDSAEPDDGVTPAATEAHFRTDRVRSSVTGHVGGSVVQAETIHGGLTFNF